MTSKNNSRSLEKLSQTHQCSAIIDSEWRCGINKKGSYANCEPASMKAPQGWSLVHRSAFAWHWFRFVTGSWTGWTRSAWCKEGSWPSVGSVSDPGTELADDGPERKSWRRVTTLESCHLNRSIELKSFGFQVWSVKFRKARLVRPKTGAQEMLIHIIVRKA